MGFKQIIKDCLINDLTEEEIRLLPRGFQTLGKVIILKLNPILLDKKELIGKACLELYPHIRSVFINVGKIEGKFRTPNAIQYLVGENNPIVEHKEHGIVYKFDITKIMFSKGNLTERKYLATVVKPNEIIIDMFAGIGYFSLPIARHSQVKQIFSIELNPDAYKSLVENIKINELQEIITPIFGNSNEEVLKLSSEGIKADRIIMGVFPAPKDFIKNALTLVKSAGTVFHYEGVIKEEYYLQLYEEFKDIAKKEKYYCKLDNKRFVKSYGPHLKHLVLDILVSRD
jgi:tRNA wybutosine-synthesizing protein 2